MKKTKIFLSIIFSLIGLYHQSSLIAGQPIDATACPPFTIQQLLDGLDRYNSDNYLVINNWKFNKSLFKAERCYELKQKYEESFEIPYSDLQNAVQQYLALIEKPATVLNEHIIRTVLKLKNVIENISCSVNQYNKEIDNLNKKITVTYNSKACTLYDALAQYYKSPSWKKYIFGGIFVTTCAVVAFAYYNYTSFVHASKWFDALSLQPPDYVKKHLLD